MFECLIDTGSNATCISETAYLLIKEKVNAHVLPVTNLFISGAFGRKSCRIKNQVFLNLKIGKLVVQSIFLIVPQLGYDVILGSDWLLKNKVIVDYEKSKLYVNKEMISESLVSF